MNNIPTKLETKNISIAEHSTRTDVRIVRLKTKKSVQTFQKQWKEQFPAYTPLEIGESVSIFLEEEATKDPVAGHTGLYAPEELASLIKYRMFFANLRSKLQDFFKKSSLFQTFSKYNFQWR